ncbi:MAG: mechanosensitive ion channel family protein [Chitinophagales bacterium]|nr:mechanosensitive ion channel family protein [Chitinophagales bacterium]
MSYPVPLNIDPKYFFYILTAVVTYAVATLLSNVLRVFLDKYFRQTSINSKIDPTRYAFSKNAVSLVIFVLATIFVFYTIPSLRTLGLTLFASAGIFAAILGFASQAAFSNIISGIFIVVFKPFRVEDVIKIGKDYEGIVEDITLRHTVLRNYENRRIVIPNAVISNEVITNSSWDGQKVCTFIEIGIGYEANIDKAMLIMAEETKAHPLFVNIGDSGVLVKVVNLGETAVILRAWAWANDHLSGLQLKFDLLKSIKERFQVEGIEIPYTSPTIIQKHSKDIIIHG